jgi:antitoxin component YwqK of YwqJK toxin-antitoxin module
MPIRIKCTFHDDALDGAYEERYRNGGARIQCSYRAGIKQQYIEYYHNGQKRYDLKFKRMLKEEKSYAVLAGREYYENGKLCYKGEFANYTRTCGLRAYIDSRGGDGSKDEFLDEFTMLYHGPGTKYNEQGEKVYDGQWNSGTFAGTKP